MKILLLSNSSRCAVAVADYELLPSVDILYRGTTDVHTTRVNLLIAVMGVEDIVQMSFLVVEWGSVPTAYKVAWKLQYWVVRQLLPRTANVGCRGTADTIFLACVAIARVE